MIPASQLTIDTSLEGVFGEDPPEGVERLQEVGDEFGEQELVTIVVDYSKSNGTIAKMFLEDLAKELTLISIAVTMGFYAIFIR